MTLDHSETSTEAEQAPAKARAYAGMFTVPCPRHYCQDLAGRQACKVEAERCFERAADGRFQKSVENQGLPAQLDQNRGCG